MLSPRDLTGSAPVVVVLAALLSMPVSPVAAQQDLERAVADFDLDRGSLAGLSGLFPTVSLAENIGQQDRMQERLITYMESRLRQAGIRVLSREEFESSSQKPWLRASVFAQQIKELGTVYTLRIDVWRKACITGYPETGAELSRIDGCRMVSVWEIIGQGTTPSLLHDSSLIGAVRESMVGWMDALVNDYLAANGS